MKFRILRPVFAWVTVEVEADSKEHALALEEEMPVTVSSLVGNGGIDKMIGVDESYASIAAGDINYDAEPEVST